jgi:hypothetical protein
VEQKERPDEVSFKNQVGMKELLLEDIKLPSFYSHVAGLKDLVVMMGAHFVDSPHYITDE